MNNYLLVKVAILESTAFFKRKNAADLKKPILRLFLTNPTTRFWSWDSHLNISPHSKIRYYRQLALIQDRSQERAMGAIAWLFI